MTKKSKLNVMLERLFDEDDMALEGKKVKLKTKELLKRKNNSEKFVEFIKENSETVFVAEESRSDFHTLGLYSLTRADGEELSEVDKLWLVHENFLEEVSEGQ